jgi:hypothetical protein
MFRARNQEWSPEERTTEVGRRSPHHESELATAKELMAQNAQVLADSLERSRVLEEELGHLRGASRLVVTEVLGPHWGSSALIVDLLEIPGERARRQPHHRWSLPRRLGSVDVNGVASPDPRL